jgi:hypothetical protein
MPDDSAFSLADFDQYIEEHGIPEEDYPAAFALWIAERTGGPVPRFEKVEREPPGGRGFVIEGDEPLKAAANRGGRRRVSCQGTSDEPRRGRLWRPRGMILLDRSSLGATL